MRKNLLLSLVTLGIALAGAEAVVRIVDPIRPPDRVEYQVDAETYWRVVPDQADSHAPAVTVNSSGFRGKPLGTKQPERVRVFVLGDSYTWGMGVADDDTYSEQLERMSGGRLEVINGGTPGWGVFQFKVRLERWIETLEPDIVVVLINTADVLRQPYESEQAEQEFLRQSRLRNRIRSISKLVTVIYRLYDRYRLERENRQVANAVPMGPAGTVSAERFSELLGRDTARLAEMASVAKQHGARFVLAAWPQRLPMTPTFLQAMEAMAREHEMIYIDLSEKLAAHESDEYSLPNDHHPNALGHRLIAEELSSRMRLIGGIGSPGEQD